MHLHSVYDGDTHFAIDPTTRQISNRSDKSILGQYDHNSERFSFELPRFVESHDMSLCNRVEVHYINVGVGGEQKKGVYPVDDLQISPDSEGIVICSWLISANSTQLAGSLNFLIRFACVAEDGTIDYAWHTEIFSGITVSDGMNNGEAVVAEYPDVLEAWKAEVLGDMTAMLDEAQRAAQTAKAQANGAAESAAQAAASAARAEAAAGSTPSGGSGSPEISLVEHSITDGGGVSITVTKPDGTTNTARLYDGNDGDDGKSAYQYAKEGGYTGTEEEFAEDMNPDNIQAYIASELAKRGQLKPEPSQSIADMTDTSKMYVMLDKTSPDYGYIFAYMYGEVTIEPTNAIPKSTDTDRTTIFNGKGYQLGLRINSSGAVTSSSAPAVMGVTGFIPAKVGDVIDLKNWEMNTSYTNYIAAYDSSNSKTGMLTIKTSTVFPVTLDAATFGSDFNAIRVSGNLTDATEVINLSNAGTTSGYAWTNTGLAFVPADYEGRIIKLERGVAELEKSSKLQNILGISEVFAPSPQLPADGSETADFNGLREYITAEQIYAYIDALLHKYPRFLTKEVMGKDASGTHDWCRYICCRRAYDAWQKPNYPPMYAWVNGSTVIYSVSVSPRVGDTLYTTAYIGTAKGTVSAVSNANQSRTVGGVVYARDKSKDIEPTLVYTETGYSPYFSSNYASTKNGVFNGNKVRISTISSINNGTLTDTDGATYTRYPLGDRDSKFKNIPAIVIGANEHGTGGDPATPAMVSARMIKDLCECRNADNPLLNLLKNEYMMVFCPVINPWGFDKSNQKYSNFNGVNIDRNFDTPGWRVEDPAGWNPGEYGGSENEAQYFMNTLVASKTKIAMANHSYGEGKDSTTGEAVSGGICSYMFGRNNSKYTESLLQIAEVMAANYNLVFNDNGEAKPEDWGKTRSYIAWIGAEGGALEMNSRDGFITDPNNETKGAQFTARVMEAAYTELLQFLYMLIDKAE